ncbi:MAG: tautomerase family protein [Calditerrivibrio sp.]|nr:tautomerase family protein [Calditerrivibrio sp.]
MPVVRVEMWQGKSKEVKDNIAKDITEVFVKNLGCPPEAVTVVYDDRPKTDWYTGGKSHDKLYVDK